MTKPKTKNFVEALNKAVKAFEAKPDKTQTDFDTFRNAIETAKTAGLNLISPESLYRGNS